MHSDFEPIEEDTFQNILKKNIGKKVRIFIFPDQHVETIIDHVGEDYIQYKTTNAKNIANGFTTQHVNISAIRNIITQ